MATSRGPILTEKEEKQLTKLRQRLFESRWDSAEFKESVRDLSPSEVYREDSGFKVYVGNCNHASDLPKLEEKGISFILNMAASDSTCQMSADVYSERETYEFIEEARSQGAAVLVHCVAGASRSCTVAIAYLMQRHGWSLEKAGSHVRKRRAKVFPNLGFMKQLLQLEKQLAGKPLSKAEKHQTYSTK